MSKTTSKLNETILKSDEELFKIFETEKAITEMQSNGQETLTGDFKCFKAGYAKGLYHGTKLRPIID